MAVLISEIKCKAYLSILVEIRRNEIKMAAMLSKPVKLLKDKLKILFRSKDMLESMIRLTNNEAKS